MIRRSSSSSSVDVADASQRVPRAAPAAAPAVVAQASAQRPPRPPPCPVVDATPATTQPWPLSRNPLLRLRADPPFRPDIAAPWGQDPAAAARRQAVLQQAARDAVQRLGTVPEEQEEPPISR